MSWQIQIFRAKPNPDGKDRSANGATHTQLLGEWVDLKNIGDAPVNVSSLHLTHKEFDDHCHATNAGPQLYWNGSGSEILHPGKVLRVHTGHRSQMAQMNPSDAVGADLHSYADRSNFVLNNKCGDEIGVWWKTSAGEWKKADSASYDPQPKEGAVLVRIGQKLA